MDIDKLKKSAKYVIEFSESSEALKVLKDLKILLKTYSLDKTNPELHNELKKMEGQVKIVAFPVLPDEESENILRNNILESFYIDFSMENAVTEKLFLEPYGVRRELREFLKKALLQNKEVLGGATLGQWISKFDSSFNYKTRNESAIVQFIINDPDAKQIDIKEKEILKKILHLYDSLLIYTPIADEREQNKMLNNFRKNGAPRGQLSDLKQSPSRNSYFSEAERNRYGASENIATGRSFIEEVSLREALQKYPKLGEQIISSDSIKIKSFDRPVRPSIRNWLYDYTSHLGQAGHSSMDRTNYLFRSENAINLSSPEKEKLSIILRSFDENAPLPIDAARQEVVFGELTKQSSPLAPQRIASSRPASAPSLNFIHHVERQPVRQASPASSGFAQPEKKPDPELFVKPYARTEPQKSPAFSQNSASPKIQPPAQSQTLDDPQSPSFNMKFTNPYPTPGTHESKFEQKNDNIANVSFSEGIPKAPAARVSAKRMPGPDGTLSASSAPIAAAPSQNPSPASAPQAVRPVYQRPQPNRNIIYPHLLNEFPSGNPEPKIKGNTVDLSMNNDQRTTNNKS